MESTNPESTGAEPRNRRGNERQRADKLFAGFDVGQQAFHAETKQRVAVGVIVLFADDDEAGFRKALQNVGEQRAGRGLAA